MQRSYRLEAGEGVIELMSNPKGAWVEVNGERLAAITPTQITLTSGTHRIRMGKAERRDAKTELVLKSGSTQQVNLNLSMDPHGSLSLKLRPASAKVRSSAQILNTRPECVCQWANTRCRSAVPGMSPRTNASPFNTATTPNKSPWPGVTANLK